MRLSRSLYSLSLACLALSFAFVALSPSRALAQWTEAQGSTTYARMWNQNTVPTSFSISNQTGTHGGYQYSTYIDGSPYYVNSSGTAYGIAWNAKPTVGNPVIQYRRSFAGGQIPKGKKFIIRDGASFLVYYTTVSSPTKMGDYNNRTLTGMDFHYWVSDTNNANRREITPNSDGTFTAPIDVQYVWISASLQALPSGSWTYWCVNKDFDLLVELPEDQNEVEAINNQTETLVDETQNQTDTLMDTTGSDGIANDSVVGGQVQQVQNLDIFGLIGDVSQNVGNTITTQEVDTGVVFPGMSLAGFELPAATIDPMSGLSEDMQNTIKLMVTFVFCAAFISHIVSLAHAIFGIWEYGVGAEDFGNGEYTFSRKPVNWSGDYSIDEDLGF